MSEEAPAIVGIAALAIDCTDPLGLAHWWRRLLGGSIDVDPQGDVVTLHTPAGLAIDFLRVPEPKTGKNRLHLDVRSHDFATTSGLALGRDRRHLPVDAGGCSASRAAGSASQTSGRERQGPSWARLLPGDLKQHCADLFNPAK
jgi:hypothetical protein